VPSPVPSSFIVSVTADEMISKPAAPAGPVTGKAGLSYICMATQSEF
jgi:hypothetical protein